MHEIPGASRRFRITERRGVEARGNQGEKPCENLGKFTGQGPQTATTQALQSL